MQWAAGSSSCLQPCSQNSMPLCLQLQSGSSCTQASGLLSGDFDAPKGAGGGSPTSGKVGRAEVPARASECLRWSIRILEASHGERANELMVRVRFWTCSFECLSIIRHRVVVWVRFSRRTCSFKCRRSVTCWTQQCEECATVVPSGSSRRSLGELLGGRGEDAQL